MESYIDEHGENMRNHDADECAKDIATHTLNADAPLFAFPSERPVLLLLFVDDWSLFFHSSRRNNLGSSLGSSLGRNWNRPEKKNTDVSLEFA
jgi:hypothetical protein